MAQGIRSRPAAKRNPYESNKICGVNFTIGIEAANVIRVSAQLLNPNQQNFGAYGAVKFWLSNHATNGSIATVSSGGIAAGANGNVVEDIADLSGFLFTNSDGAVDIDITETATPTFYLYVLLPSGQVVISGPITFA